MSSEVKQTEQKHLRLDKSISNLEDAVIKLNDFIEGLFNLSNPKLPNEKDNTPLPFAQVLDESSTRINKATEMIEEAVQRLRDILF